MSIYLRTDLEGKINNLPDFKSESLCPVFEAVANSIHAIEEIHKLTDGKIIIRILREKQAMFIGNDDKQIIGFEVEDNGIGFNDANLESFKTAESTYKLKKGGKGIGRFFWLKAFDRVEIDSTYDNNGNIKGRTINFSSAKGIQEKNNGASVSYLRTRVKLMGFKKEYREQPSAYKTIKKIAQRIFEHCLSYYISKNAPTILVEDSADGNKINLNDLYNEIENDISTDIIKLSNEKFIVSHIKLYSTYKDMHNIVLCADSRDVQSIDIAKTLGTSAQFDEDNKKFIYTAYVSSSYLDKYVDAVRNSFNIPKSRNELNSLKCMITMEELLNAITEKTKIYLSSYLDNIMKRKKDIVTEYVSYKNPMLRSVPRYCPEIFNEIEPNSSEARINEVLYKYKGKTEFEIRKQAENLLKTQPQTLEEIQEDYNKVTCELKDVQKDQLAGYIVYRKMIIDLLDKKLGLDSEKKYSREEVIHDILFPRKVDTEQINFEDHNMWLIDERLTFHTFATSDKPFKSFGESTSDDRADILVFSEVNDNRIAGSVSIVELKKPKRKQYDEDPVTQMLGYIRKIKNKKIQLPNGRDINVNASTRFYCYGLCDINDKIIEFAENNNYTELRGELGYYTFNPKLNAHIELLAFDKIISDAKQRHKAFFEKLGI